MTMDNMPDTLKERILHPGDRAQDLHAVKVFDTSHYV